MIFSLIRGKTPNTTLQFGLANTQTRSCFLNFWNAGNLRGIDSLFFASAMNKIDDSNICEISRVMAGFLESIIVELLS